MEEGGKEGASERASERARVEGRKGGGEEGREAGRDGKGCMEQACMHTLLGWKGRMEREGRWVA